MFNNQILAGAAGQGGSFYPYSIDQSLRFNNDDTAYLQFTPSSAGNRDTWTLSMWVKRSGLGLAQSKLFAAGSSLGSNHNNSFYMWFQSDDTLRIQNESGGAAYTRMDTTRVFRDVSSFYHIVYVYDSSQSTSSDRQQLYINGVRETVFDDTLYPSLNQDSQVNATHVHRIGASTIGNTFDGYMAEVNFIDGTALDATSFGETSNGVWVPKAYSGSYGTNGFYLSFANSAAIGDDLSGNTNDWTANNLAASDVVPDSPTNNWATNNGAMRANITQSEGNLKMVGVGTNYDNMASTFTFDVEDSEGWYWEYRSIGNDTATTIGISTPQNTEFNQSDPTNPFSNTTACVSYNGDGQKKVAGTNSSYGNSWTAGDIIGIAVKAGAVYFYKNGTIQNSGTAAATGLTGDYVAAYAINGTQSGTANYGQDSTFAGATTAGGNSDANGLGDFKYSVPSGYKALCSANLPEPAIGPNSTTTSDQHFNIALYQSNGGLNTITGLGHQPDFLWIKQRDSTNSHALTDSVRGPTKALSSNLADSEYTYSNGLQSFDSDGFTLNGDNGWYNSTTVRNYVAWSWKAGGTAVSNTDGSITSQVSANQDAGISIVTYTGTGSNATVGHGLSQTPEYVVTKSRDSALSWYIYAPGKMSADKVLAYNATNAEFGSAGAFIESDFNATTFGVGTETPTNKSGDSFVAHCFHSVEGYSKVGSYTGNANADGPFVYTGFRPAFVLIKVVSTTNNWFIYDNKREGYNQDNDTLSPNLTSVEDTTYKLDLVSNGFKIRGSQNAHNQSGQTFLYLAFAEQPFKYANAR